MYHTLLSSVRNTGIDYTLYSELLETLPLDYTLLGSVRNTGIDFTLYSALFETLALTTHYPALLETLSLTTLHNSVLNTVIDHITQQCFKHGQWTTLTTPPHYLQTKDHRKHRLGALSFF